MASGRFILRYRGPGPPPAADVGRIRGLADVRVVDETPRMLIVESDAEPLGALVDGLADWIMAPDQSVPLPDTRARVERPPE